MSLIFEIPNTQNSSAIKVEQNVNQFNDLASGQEIGNLAYVKSSQGTRWLYGSLGGTYYPKGFYIWNGTDWVSDVDEIADQFYKNSLRFLDNEIPVRTASDFPVPVDPTKLYVIDTDNLDMGSTPIVIGSGGFFYRGSDYFISTIFSTADNYTMFVNESGQPAGNIRGRNVEHYVSGLNSRIFGLDNQETFGAIEFNSCNFGRFASETPSLGELSNYRQFRTNDCGFFRLADGLTFSGTWAGGFRISDTILLSIPANAEVFKEGINLIFNGSSFSDLNAVGVDDTAHVFTFTENNFSLDEGFITDNIRFNINSNPIPFADLSSTKFKFRGRGIKNTFPGGRWEITTQTATPLTQNTLVKALGTTTYDDLVHFSGLNNNEFIYDSNVEKDFIIQGQIVVDGTANDIIDLVIRKWNNSLSQYEDLRTFTRNISNLIGMLNVSYFNPYVTTTLFKNDRIELWVRNTSSSSSITVLEGSFLTIGVRN